MSNVGTAMFDTASGWLITSLDANPMTVSLVHGSEANLGAIGALYNLTMDPYEKYDMTFNGAAPTRVLSTSRNIPVRTMAGRSRSSSRS